MIPANRAALEARWPALVPWLDAAPDVPTTCPAETPVPTLVVQGIRLAGAYDPRAEAALQAGLLPPDATRATCYGIGQGELPRALLGREGLAELTVVLFHPGLARAVFAHADQADWMSDPRVSLVRAQDTAEIAIPFAAAPADLRLADGPSARLRDLVQLELATPHIRHHLRAAEEEIARRLADNRERVRADGDVAELFGTARGATFFLAAAGPSLADHFEILRDRGARPLLAVDGALQALLAAGVCPDIVLSMDPHPEGPGVLLDVDPQVVAETVLVYDPVVHPAALERWPGRRLVMYGPGPRHDALRREIPRGTLWSSGSVLHTAAALAVEMGAARVTFFGADFATLGGKSHVDGFAWQKDLTQRAARGPWLESGAGERIPSLPNLVGYLRELERFLARHPRVQWINAGRRGARIAGTSYPEEVDD